MSEEKTMDLELYEWEVTDLIGTLKRHRERIKEELETIDDEGVMMMLRTQKRKTDNLLEKISEIHEEKSSKK